VQKTLREHAGQQKIVVSDSICRVRKPADVDDGNCKVQCGYPIGTKVRKIKQKLQKASERGLMPRVGRDVKNEKCGCREMEGSWTTNRD
jgi:hypothetical protein